MRDLIVAVGTRNRSPMLRQTLIGLCQQDAPPAAYEIVVVDNASTDDTRQVIESFRGARVPVRYVYEAVPGLCETRNRAWREATAPLIAYIDDDAIPEPGWIAALLETYASVSPPPASVGGKVTLVWEDGQPAWLHSKMWAIFGHIDYGEDRGPLRPNMPLFGANMSFQTEILRRLNGFNPIFSALTLGEETELFRRLHAQGQLVYYQPRAVIRHMMNTRRHFPQAVIRRYYRMGQSRGIITALHNKPGRVGSLFALAREFIRKRAMVRTGLRLLARRLPLAVPASVFPRCELAAFWGFELLLLRFLASGRLIISEDRRLLNLLTA